MVSMNYRVEGLPYPTQEQACVVAQRFARRYGRDIPVTSPGGTILYYVTQAGKKVGVDGKPVK